MPTSDTSEAGLEALIAGALVARGGYVTGSADNYDRTHAVDVPMLMEFLETTQPHMHAKVRIGTDAERAATGLTEAAEAKRQRDFLARLSSELTKRGVIDVLRRGVKHLEDRTELFYGTPSPGNATAAELHAANVFSVTRQVRYSTDATGRALDLVLFINGLPIATFEVKNRLTGQTVADAVQQYRRDRDARETLFGFGRCAVHFAVDEDAVQMCTKLHGADSWFLPFNRGHNDGAGNPPNPDGLRTAYLWEEILTRASLTDIIENYAQIVEQRDETGRVRRDQIFPRYHQLAVVRGLLEKVAEDGVGARYLVQHSAGSGKSNSIAWLARQLIELKQPGGDLLDSVIVVTDRRVLDKQLRDTIKRFNQVGANFGEARSSEDLRRFLAEGKKIITTTVQKFPFVLDALATERAGRQFAIIIDEAHSSQGGRAAAQMNRALATPGAESDDPQSVEDTINALMEARGMLPNAVYVAFTATPKRKTLETFGERTMKSDGTPDFTPFHTYSMKQAIQEGFILDVLANYTPVKSYYRIVTTAPDDPEFDTQKARAKLRKYVEGHSDAIRAKAEIMVDHFQEQVYARRKINGQARAMIVTGGITRAIEYHHAVTAYLRETRSPLRAVVAFSGEHAYSGIKVTEATLNGFPSGRIPEMVATDPYRFLIVADKFQTGYDEPLLHTMYVDKMLGGIQAVQTLSRLNRAFPNKHDTFVLDFANDADAIQAAFVDFYRTTILSGETDPNKLHNLADALDDAGVYEPYHVEDFVAAYIAGADRDRLDPILDTCVEKYNALPDGEAQAEFKGGAKAFVRTYTFLAAILPFTNAVWEKLSVFLTFLVPKLPAPDDTDLSTEILGAIDLESYRAEVQTALSIALPDEDATIEPLDGGVGGGHPDPEMERLSAIVRTFNDLFGNIEWKDADKIRRVIAEELPMRVAADPAYQNAIKNSDAQNARIEHDRALGQVITDLLSDHTDLFRYYHDNSSFKDWLAATIFGVTYRPSGGTSAQVAVTRQERTERLIEDQFGAASQWTRANRAVWAFFRDRPGERLGTAAITRIAFGIGIEERDIVSLLNMLAGSDPPFVRRVYYIVSPSGETDDVAAETVMQNFARLRSEDPEEQAAWQDWAKTVLIGWEAVQDSANGSMHG